MTETRPCCYTARFIYRPLAGLKGHGIRSRLDQPAVASRAVPLAGYGMPLSTDRSYQNASKLLTVRTEALVCEVYRRCMGCIERGEENIQSGEALPDGTHIRL